MNILYIGNSLCLLDTICSFIPEINIKAAFYQISKTSQEELNKINKDIELYPVSYKNELKDSISKFYGEIDFALMYNFGIIIPEEIIEHMSIFNFHPGSLTNNRGSSPINWAILLGWLSTCMSLHKITHEIDVGELISEHECKIYDIDTPYTLRLRLEGEIASMILELLSYLTGKINSRKVIDGVYRPRITEADYTINADIDSDDTVKAKIRSQAGYKGAILFVEGKKYYIKNFCEYEKIIRKGELK